jgi:DNA polymerase-1
MTSRPIFFLIDGHALAYRQFFALPVASFNTRSGEPTNATFGFARTLLDILQKDKPQYLAVSFDKGLSGRDQLYDEYKGTRDKMPGELITQMERITQMVKAFNIPILAHEGYEADDIIGTIVPLIEAENVDVRIITGDRDILQLLTDHIKVQIPSRSGPDTVYDLELFRQTYGLEPWQLVDLKALMGDSSDNIPGVKGIGEKTATQLLQQHGDLDGVYAHIDEIKGATQKKLIEGRDSAYLSKQLAMIRRDAPITLDLPACTAHDFDIAKVENLFRELEFRSLSERLQASKSEDQLTLFNSSDEPAARPSQEIVNTVIVRDQTGLDELVKTLSAAQAIAFDVETTSTDQMAGTLVGISLAVDDETGYYIPVGHQSGEQLPLKTVLDALRAPLSNPNIPKYAWNASFDLVMMQRNGVDVTPITFDGMVAEWVRDPTSKHLGLKNFANFVLRPPVVMTHITELIGTGKKQITMDAVAIEQCAPYAAADAAITYRGVEFLRPKLEMDGLLDLFNSIEMPLIPVIASMEQAGVVLDKRALSELSERMAAQLTALEKEIYAMSGGYGEFNINSPKQLNDVLFGKLGLKADGVRKTAHGYSTAADVLDNLKGEHPIIELLLQYREISKLKSTYVDALPALINPLTGRVHTSYNQAGAATGRISSSNPNLQNIPIRTEAGREVRRAFVAPEGKRLLSVDYSQIELRVLAHLSQDTTLLDAFAQGQDIHAATAAAVYGIPLEDVTYEQRNFAKRVNFGLIYGMGAYRLARDSDLTLAEARSFIETYFQRLPRVRVYLEETKRRARQKEGLQTLFGRKRRFPVLINADQRSNQVAIQGEERVAINMPIQGSAADIMKKAMIGVYNELKAQHLNAKMILQVHDELVLEVPERQIPETRDLVVRVMEGVCELDAPLRANAQVGMNWRDMETA